MKYLPAMLVGVGLSWVFKIGDIVEITVIDPKLLVARVVVSILAVATMYILLWGWDKIK